MDLSFAMSVAMAFCCNFTFAIVCVFLRVKAIRRHLTRHFHYWVLIKLLIKGRSDDARCRPGRETKTVKWNAMDVGLTLIIASSQELFSLTARP
jgi:hypothetical protein